MKKLILLLLLLAVLALSIFVYRNYFSVSSQPYQRDVANEKSSTVTANEIIRQFKSNDTAVNQKYLNKTVSVSGKVGKIETGLDGNITITLQSNDSTASVFCTLKSPSEKPTVGSTITVKGICTGLLLNDVVLNEAIIVK